MMMNVVLMTQLSDSRLRFEGRHTNGLADQMAHKARDELMQMENFGC